jgi:hypothetical protein
MKNPHLTHIKSILDGTVKEKNPRWETEKAVKLANTKLEPKNQTTVREVRENLIADCDVEDIKNGLYTTEELAFHIEVWANSGKLCCIKANEKK